MWLGPINNEGKTQAEIAIKQGVNRERGYRILQDFRDNGLVQIIIDAEEASCSEVEGLLEKKFGLVKAIVVPTPAKEVTFLQPLGRRLERMCQSLYVIGRLLALAGARP